MNLILAPPTAGVRASSCQAVPRLELVEAGGKALVGTCHRRTREVSTIRLMWYHSFSDHFELAQKANC